MPEPFAFKLPHIGEDNIAILDSCSTGQSTNFIAIGHGVEVTTDENGQIGAWVGA